ncbi:MAG: preprotein translocase subunit SecE [Bryobacteraceae bacterium]|nr:preprotein translocase subunit SecE [Bryobacteraceae bacterium]
MASQSPAIPKSGGAKGIASWPARARDYFDGLKNEMKHVTWPSRMQVRGTTAVVLAAVFLFAAYFAAVDLVLGRVINQIFQTLARR